MSEAPKRILTAGTDGEIEYIRADLVAPKVRPLVWEEAGFECRSSGMTVTGEYYAARTHVGPFFTARRGSLLLSTECMSMDEAIERCNREHKRRILEALE